MKRAQTGGARTIDLHKIPKDVDQLPRRYLVHRYLANFTRDFETGLQRLLMRTALALDIDGRHRDAMIVATIGRAITNNVVLPPSRNYSRHQCTFFHNRSSGELLIEDRSSSGNTSIEYSDEGLIKFEFSGHLRRRVLRPLATIRLNFYTASFNLHIGSSQGVHPQQIGREGS
jgi:FHA domain